MNLSLALIVLVMLCSCAVGDTHLAEQSKDDVYIFSSFRGNGNSGLHLSYSLDGLTWTAINQDQSVLTPDVGGKLMRDPCIILGPDNTFHMVWTSSWEDGGIGVAHSKDLITWSEQQFIPVMKNFPTAKNAWAPEIIWDDDNQQYVIYWASTIPGQFPETEKQADKGWDHRIYATTTQNFRDYSQTTIFYQPDFNVIDSTIIKTDDDYVMILKDETRYPAAKNLKVARSSSIFGPWEITEQAFTPENTWVEGPTIVKHQDWFYVYYDEYINHQYGAMRTQDFNQWQNVSAQLTVPKGTRHGTVVKIPAEKLTRLLQYYN